MLQERVAELESIASNAQPGEPYQGSTLSRIIAAIQTENLSKDELLAITSAVWNALHRSAP